MSSFLIKSMIILLGCSAIGAVGLFVYLNNNREQQQQSSSHQLLFPTVQQFPTAYRYENKNERRQFIIFLLDKPENREEYHRLYNITKKRYSQLNIQFNGCHGNEYSLDLFQTELTQSYDTQQLFESGVFWNIVLPTLVCI